jgi:hypothetical protein
MNPPRCYVRPFVLGLLTLALSSSASAQRLPEPWDDPVDQPARVDLSVSYGFVAPSDWSDLVLLGSLSPATGVLEQVIVRDLRVASDTQVDGSVTYWRGRYGFRVQGGLSKSMLTIGGPPTAAFNGMSVGMDTYSYDVRGAVGFVEYAPQRWVWPYGFFGFGGITYDLEQTVPPSLLTFIERPPVSGGGSTIIVDDTNRNFLLAVDELKNETVFALNFGVGTDIRVPMAHGGVGIRLELSNQVAPSPVELRIGDARRSYPLGYDTGVHFGLVNHMRVSAGVVVQIGR